MCLRKRVHVGSELEAHSPGLGAQERGGTVGRGGSGGAGREGEGEKEDSTGGKAAEGGAGPTEGRRGARDGLHSHPWGAPTCTARELGSAQ